jgi:allantoin racemase
LIGHLASVRELGIPVVELRNDLGALKEAFLEQARNAVESDGADVIVPGCGRIYGLSGEFSAELGVPVLDPLATSVGYAEMLIKLALTCSKKAYPDPPLKRREIWR